MRAAFAFLAVPASLLLAASFADTATADAPNLDLHASGKSAVGNYQLTPNIQPAEEDLAPRYEFHFTFGIPSDGVPIEDSLVVTLQTSDGEIVARTSARL